MPPKRPLEGFSTDAGESSGMAQSHKKLQLLADRNQGYEGSSEENIKKVYSEGMKKYAEIEEATNLRVAEINRLIDKLPKAVLEVLEKKCAIRIPKDSSYVDRYTHFHHLCREGLEHFRSHIDKEEVDRFITDCKSLQSKLADYKREKCEYDEMVQVHKDNNALNNATQQLQSLNFKNT